MSLQCTPEKSLPTHYKWPITSTIWVASLAVTPKPVKTSEKAEEMLRFDLENEKETIRQYRRRIKQSDELNEFAITERLRNIIVQEQDHLIALATALGIDPPDPGIAD